MKRKNTVRITLKADERLKIAEPCFIEFPFKKPIIWADIKEQIEEKYTLKKNWSSRSYCLYDWLINDERGEELLEDTEISEDITVWARSNYTNFQWEGTTLIGYKGKAHHSSKDY